MDPTLESLPTAAPLPPRLGLAVASLVLGIVAVCLSLFLIGAVFGLIGLALGWVHIAQKRGPNAQAWWGISLSLLSIVASIGLGLIYYQGFKAIKTTIGSMAGGNGSGAFMEWEGVLAPDISVTTLDGKKIQLSEFKGKCVVLDFWATWCGPCVRELPHFIKLQNETTRDELVVVGISKEDEMTLKTFVKTKGVNYPIASATDLPSPYKDVQAVPTTFFIDRKGVIQSVVVGYHEFEQLKEHALAKDFAGEAKSAPLPSPGGLQDASPMLQPVTVWSKSLPGAEAICVGDWDGDGALDILVADAGRKLHVLGVDGAEKSSVSLPTQFSNIECGRHKQGGARLLGYSNWGQKLSVMDGHGKEIWSYSAMFGIDGAHWGDLDGDGTDELIVGMNGFGGLHALSAEGKELWQARLGNVWNQAVVPAAATRSALVFATEASGSVRVFDGTGKPLRTLRPSGRYCAQLSAAVMDKAGTIQAIALGDGAAIAFDPNGQVAWSTPSVKNAGGWQNITFACGDIDGDGVRDWAFLVPAGDLVLASASGQKLASVPGQSGLNGFVIVPDGKGRGVLVTLRSGALQAYSFQ